MDTVSLARGADPQLVEEQGSDLVATWLSTGPSRSRLLVGPFRCFEPFGEDPQS